MKKYNVKQLREMSSESLQALLQELQGELVQRRFQASQGELKQVHQINRIKTAIARIMTLIQEKEQQVPLTQAENKA